MQGFALPYGSEKIIFDLPADNCQIDWIEPSHAPAAADPLQVVVEALKHPVDDLPIDSFKNVRSAAIAINDKTRPVPHEYLLPPLLAALQAAGIPEAAVQLIIATGTHLPMSPLEYERIMPAYIASRYCVLSHNCDDETALVFRGKTSAGTPVWMNRDFYDADLRIVVGNIEPHHFAGFSGGSKTAAIGLAGRSTITHNHAMLVDPNSRIAEYANNPLRQDIEEIGDLMGIHFALNATLNGEKKIVNAVSGSPRTVMQAGIPLSQKICQTIADKQYDLVIASAGGAPKDINFYQAQKALTHASLFTRDGGVIILTAACPEGSGSSSYELFMQDVTSPAEVFEKFRRQGFQVGPHKSFQVARDAARVNIILLSEIDPRLVSRLLMTPAASPREALSLALDRLIPAPGRPLRIAVLPRATNTIPV
jgi:lactate racemase